MVLERLIAREAVDVHPRLAEGDVGQLGVDVGDQ
jgi:hypothetical protein